MHSTNKVVISSIMRCKNKQSFFALHQIQNKIHALNPKIDVEFHVLWDSDESDHEKRDDEKWSKTIDEHIPNYHSYNRQFFKDYAKSLYEVSDVEKFDLYMPSYFILMAHYLRRVKMYDYYLAYDDDVVINDDFSHPLSLILDRTPMLISEPMNVMCDKVLLERFVRMFGEEFWHIYVNKNPTKMGFNSGFQGIDLSIYDNFLSVDRFKDLLSIFEYKSIYDSDGNEIWGGERSAIDTQQQSFFSLMNIVLSKKHPHFLDVNEYYVVPNWGVHPKFGKIDPEDELDGWGINLKSRITHFIGHTRGKGKPKMLLNYADKYLSDRGFEV